MTWTSTDVHKNPTRPQPGMARVARLIFPGFSSNILVNWVQSLPVLIYRISITRVVCFVFYFSGYTLLYVLYFIVLGINYH